MTSYGMRWKASCRELGAERSGRESEAKQRRKRVGFLKGGGDKLLDANTEQNAVGVDGLDGYMEEWNRDGDAGERNNIYASNLGSRSRSDKLGDSGRISVSPSFWGWG